MVDEVTQVFQKFSTYAVHAPPQQHREIDFQDPWTDAKLLDLNIIYH